MGIFNRKDNRDRWPYPEPTAEQNAADAALERRRAIRARSGLTAKEDSEFVKAIQQYESIDLPLCNDLRYLREKILYESMGTVFGWHKEFPLYLKVADELIERKMRKVGFDPTIPEDDDPRLAKIRARFGDLDTKIAATLDPLVGVEA